MFNFDGIKFNRQELSGAFGDIGTDIPLLIAMILATGLEATSVFIIFGSLQILTGLIYKLPMPVQPLKAVATIVITQKIAGSIVLGAGLAIGIVMFLLSITGALDKLNKIIPKAVVRGLQFGLGISLCLLACKEYIPSKGLEGYLLSFLSFTIIIFLIDNRKFPVSVIIIIIGIIYAIGTNSNLSHIDISFGINLPKFNIPTIESISTGFLLLALPQIPLSLGNSILATKQTANDLFPEQKQITVKKIGITYSILNLISSLFGGIPCCHGSGGMLGHYTFGGRTGGSVIIYGTIFLSLGLFFGNGLFYLVNAFPLSILGVILLFEGISLVSLIKDLISERRNFIIALFVSVISFGLPFGFLLGMLVGTLLFYSPIQFRVFHDIGINKDKDSK
ncbi:MAG: putative sulfate/molybdate transporter [Leptospira sp.]|nr:putative sulfate/molybdate transporter [Leptospira sp.]